MDKIIIDNLQVDTIIGIYDWERKTRQTLSFELEMDWDIAKAAIRDNIADTLDYGAITQSIVTFVESSRYQLIETLAEALCTHLLAQYPIPKIRLTLSKPVALHGQNRARIVIERTPQ